MDEKQKHEMRAVTASLNMAIAEGDAVKLAAALEAVQAKAVELGIIKAK